MDEHTKTIMRYAIGVSVFLLVVIACMILFIPSPSDSQKEGLKWAEGLMTTTFGFMIGTYTGKRVSENKTN
jgi:hypothetical protein